MARPMPVPSMPSRSSPRRLKGSNRLASWVAVMPRPVSRTRRRTVPSSAAWASMCTSPPGRLYLIALVSRFSSTWRSRMRSAWALPSTGPTRRLTPCRSASARTSGNASATSPASGTAWVSSLTLPVSRFDRSSMSLISDSRCSPALRMWATWSRRVLRATAVSSAVSASSSSNWVKPSTAFSGVRNSWLMRDRNCDLASLARSARALSWRATSASLLSVMSQFTPTRRTMRPRSSRTGIEREASQRVLPSGRRTRNS